MNNIQQSGFVYILHAEGTNRFKIGYSAKPQNRCQDINQQSPFPIKLIHYYPSDDAYRDEQKLHKMFNHRRVHGEVNSNNNYSIQDESKLRLLLLKTVVSGSVIMGLFGGQFRLMTR